MVSVERRFTHGGILAALIDLLFRSLSGKERTYGQHTRTDAIDAVDGAHSAASKCQRVVA